MNELIPALLANDEAEFRERVDRLKSEFSLFQIDVMDGAFVPNRSWFDIETLRGMEKTPLFELHLMVMDPASYVNEAIKLENVVRCIWHIEATANHPGLIHACHAAGKEAGLAVNPSTPKSLLAALYDDVDEILIMGAEPGFSGSAMDPRMVGRAARLHEEYPKLPIGFDINVNEKTIPEIKKAGVSRFYAASAIFDARDPLETAKGLRGLVS